MIANYHTHTWRCRHADGTEREYVEKAIESGLKILGFSDHTPQVYPNGFVCPVKMLPSELEGYVDTILDLKREYKNDIEILLGLEVEYLYTLWEPLLELIEPYPIEYMILGQHYLGNGVNEPFCGEPSPSSERLRQYCRQIREALETGKFLYFAHPDVLWYTGPGEIYEEGDLPVQDRGPGRKLRDLRVGRASRRACVFEGSDRQGGPVYREVRDPAGESG